MSKIQPIIGQKLYAVVVRTKLPPRGNKSSLPIARAFDTEGNLTNFTCFVQGLPPNFILGTKIESIVLTLDKKNSPPRWAFIEFLGVVPS